MKHTELTYTWVGRTRVTNDPKMGPIAFWRDGAEVPCVCDPECGLVCAYHAGQHHQAATVVFGG